MSFLSAIFRSLPLSTLLGGLLTAPGGAETGLPGGAQNSPAAENAVAGAPPHPTQAPTLNQSASGPVQSTASPVPPMRKISAPIVLAASPPAETMWSLSPPKDDRENPRAVDVQEDIRLADLVATLNKDAPDMAPLIAPADEAPESRKGPREDPSLVYRETREQALGFYHRL